MGTSGSGLIGLDEAEERALQAAKGSQTLVSVAGSVYGGRGGSDFFPSLLAFFDAVRKESSRGGGIITLKARRAIEGRIKGNGPGGALDYVSVNIFGSKEIN